MQILQNNGGSQDKLADATNDYVKRIDRLEARVNFISIRAEDKYDLYDQDIHNLMKARIDDCENMCKNLETRLNSALELQKEKDFNFREDFKTKINEVEVSIRTIKRNMMSINPSKSAAEATSSVGKNDTVSKIVVPLDVQNKTVGQPTSKGSDKQELISEKSHITEEQQHNFEVQFNKNMHNSGFDMIWDEIDKLRNKFDDYVH